MLEAAIVASKMRHLGFSATEILNVLIEHAPSPSKYWN